MTENWIDKIQQDAELQMLLGWAGGGFVLFVVLLILIVVWLKNRRKKQAEQTLGDIRVQSTHTPDEVEETKEHLVFQNKVSNETKDPAPPLVIPLLPASKVLPVTPEKPKQTPKTQPESISEPKPISITPTLSLATSPPALKTTSDEEKKKEILKAIEETRSREENMKILHERLRELRGGSSVETPPVATAKPELPPVVIVANTTAVEPIDEKAFFQPEAVSTVVADEISNPDIPHPVSAEVTEEKPETSPFTQETIAMVPEPTELQEPFASEHETETSENIALKTNDLGVPISNSYKITEEEEPEAVPFIQETVALVTELTERQEPFVIEHETEASKTFTEWLNTFSDKKR